MRVLIVDDEALARERLKRLLADHESCVVVGEACNGLEALTLNERLQPDVLLLDIRMPEMDGLEAARHLTASVDPPAIIFCTAFEDYAIQAFEHRAVGYLLKPVERSKLKAALNAARALSRAQMQELVQETGVNRRFLRSSSSSGMRMVPLDEVRLLMADQKYVSAYYPGGSLLLDETLKELEERYPDSLLRVHRNALVVPAHVTGLERGADGATSVVLDGVDQRPQVSRRHLAEVRQYLARL